MTFRRCLAGTVALLSVFVLPAGAAAQALGIGPRLSLVRAGAATAPPATRLFGGTLRIMSSRHVGLEGTLDYRAEFSDDRTMRIRETPLQASLLLFPVRRALSPYLLGGFGIYTRNTDTLAPSGAVVNTVSERQTGWHVGLGAEVFLVRRAAVFVDYRWRFVRFGDPADGDEPLDVPGLDRLKLSHRGSMWTGGLAFYF
jgi:hypothetical protein